VSYGIQSAQGRQRLLCFRQMASITLSLPDEIAPQIRAQQQQLPRILELGLRELNAGAQSGFDGAADVLELLAALPSPEEILSLRPSARLSARVAELVGKSRRRNDASRRQVGKSSRATKARAFRGRWLTSKPHLRGFVRLRAASLSRVLPYFRTIHAGGTRDRSRDRK
jgi:hypothetical protein